MRPDVPTPWSKCGKYGSKEKTEHRPRNINGPRSGPKLLMLKVMTTGVPVVGGNQGCLARRIDRERIDAGWIDNSNAKGGGLKTGHP